MTVERDDLIRQKTEAEEAYYQMGFDHAFAALERYSLGDYTIGRLAEILHQSPPVVREIVVRAGKRLSNADCVHVFVNYQCEKCGKGREVSSASCCYPHSPGLSCCCGCHTSGGGK